MRVAVVISADAGGLKAGVRDATGAIKQLGAEAARTASATGANRDALGRFTAAAGGARAAAKTVSEEIRKVGQSATDSGERVRRSGVELDKFERSTRNAARGAGNFSSQLRSLVTVVATFLGTRQLVAWADGWKQVEGRLTLVTKSTMELKAVQQELFNVSQRTGQAYQSTATLFQRLAQSTRDLGIQQDKLIKYTETINKAFVVSGAGAAESQAAIIQLAQAIASGVLRGDEFNSIMEQAPRLQEAFRDSLGKTSGELRKMAENGQLTVAMILKALESEAPKIAAEFQKIPKTIGRAWTELGNAMQRMVGLGDAAGGTSNLIAQSISNLATKLSDPKVIDAVGRFSELLTTGLTMAIDAVVALSPLMDTLAAILAGLVAVQVGTWLAGIVSGLAAATAAGLAFVATPFGAAIAAIGLATAGIAALWLESESAAQQERLLAQAMKETEDVRRLSSDQIREMTGLERNLTTEKMKQAIATQQQALAERLRNHEALQTSLDKERAGMSPLYNENDPTDPANTFGRIPFLKGQVERNWADIDRLRASVLQAKIDLAELLAGDVAVNDNSPGGGGGSGLSDKIAKARAGIDALREAVLDLTTQQMAIGQGGSAAVLDIQDAQKARDMLLEFGEAAKLGSTDIAVLEKAAGATSAEIAGWLASQRELNDSINETGEQIQKLADAPKVFADFVADLELQNKELKLELAGRKALIPLLRAEMQLKERMGRDLTPEEKIRLQEQITEQERLNKAIADQEAAQDAAKKSAEMMQEPFKNALRGIQQSFSDTFRQILDGNVDSFKDMGSAVLNIFKQLAAEIATLLVFQPIVGNILGGLGLGNLGASLGVSQPGAGGGTGILGSLFGGAGTAAGGTGGAGFSLTDLVGKGLSLGNLFSGSGASGGIGTMLFGTPGMAAVGGSHPMSAVAGTSGLLGSGGGGLASFLNSGIGGGLFSGITAAGMTLLSGGSMKDAAFSGGGAALGAAIGSIIPGVGTMLGGMLGGLAGSMLGGLFGKKPKWKKSKMQSGAHLGFNENGFLGVTDTYTIAKRMEGNTAIGQQLGDKSSNAFNEFMAGIGAEFDPSMTGDVRYLYRVKKKGKKTKGERESWAAWFGGEHLGTTQNADELMPIFLSGALAVASEQGKLSGLSPSTGKIFETLFNDNNRQGIKDSAEIQDALDFGKFYDEVDRIRTPAEAAAAALKALKVEMMKAKNGADDYGLSLDKIDDIFRNKFLDDIEDQILAIKDPQALALREEEKAAAERIAIATELGIDLAKVEELNALKRQEVVATGLASVTNQFREFFDELTLGELSTLSPTKQLDQARGRYEDVVASGDQSSFVEAARNYLEKAKAYYGTTETYAAIFDQILGKTREYGNIPGFAAGGDHLGGFRVVGEKGWELEATGPARYYSHDRSIAMLRQAANANAGFGGRVGLMSGSFGGAGGHDPRAAALLGEIRDLQEEGLSMVARSVNQGIGALLKETRRGRQTAEHTANRLKYGS
jgi:tape measure domain-containing protein